MNKLKNNFIIFWVNLIWMIPCIIWSQALIKPSNTPFIFVFLFYLFFYFSLSIVYSLLLTKQRFLTFAVIIGFLSGAILGFISWCLAEISILGFETFIQIEYRNMGLKEFIYSNFARSSMFSLHFIVGTLSAITSFLIIEKRSKNEEK